MTENEQLKRIINKITAELNNKIIQFAAAESLAEMWKEKAEELEQQLDELGKQQDAQVEEQKPKGK